MKSKNAANTARAASRRAKLEKHKNVAGSMTAWYYSKGLAEYSRN